MTLTIKNHQILIDDEDAEFVQSRVWCFNVTPSGAAYAQTGVLLGGRWRQVRLHHCVAGQHLTLKTDHINGNPLDNRRSNLRFVTPLQNMWNRTKRSKTASSRFKGVHWGRRHRRWVARITVHGKRLFLGLFADETEAARAYNVKALELFGEFAHLNNVFD